MRLLRDIALFILSLGDGLLLAFLAWLAVVFWLTHLPLKFPIGETVSVDRVGIGLVVDYQRGRYIVDLGNGNRRYCREWELRHLEEI